MIIASYASSACRNFRYNTIAHALWYSTLELSGRRKCTEERVCESVLPIYGQAVCLFFRPDLTVDSTPYMEYTYMYSITSRPVRHLLLRSLLCVQ